MLLKITDGQALDERKLMDVYAESNLENTDFFCPEEPDKEAAVRMVESGFLDFLKNEFFKEPEAICWVLEEDGVWVSALRICRSVGFRRGRITWRPWRRARTGDGRDTVSGSFRRSWTQ